jgi:hypothetical protein
MSGRIGLISACEGCGEALSAGLGRTLAATSAGGKRWVFMRVILAATVFVAFVAPLVAQDAVPPIPRPRPEATGKIADPVTPEAQNPAIAEAEEPLVPLPRPRPAAKTEPVTAADEPVKQEPKEPRVYQVACPAVLTGQVEAKSLPPISENQCQVQSPISLTGVSVNGRMVPVTGGVVTDCAVATVLPQWAEAIDGYLWAHENGRLKTIIVGTSYMCRPRNNVAGADISEHGFADALDVVGFELEDRRKVTVTAGWADALSNDGRLLRFAHDSACSVFTTTLGPEANALHHDHLHVDLGCHGKTCTARLCE